MIKKLIIPGSIAAAFLMTPVIADTGMNGDMATEGASGEPGISASQGEGYPRFDELDRNDDGQLSEDELNVWGASAAGNDYEDADDPGEAMMMDYDRDDDGSVSPEELHEGPRKDMKDQY